MTMKLSKIFEMTILTIFYLYEGFHAYGIDNKARLIFALFYGFPGVVFILLDEVALDYIYKKQTELYKNKTSKLEFSKQAKRIGILMIAMSAMFFAFYFGGIVCYWV